MTNTYTEDNSPIFHPDGRRIIYRDEQDSLWIMGADGSDRRLLISGPDGIEKTQFSDVDIQQTIRVVYIYRIGDRQELMAQPE